MNISNKFKQAIFIFTTGLALAGCQKLDRPALGSFETDPTPPPYSDLKTSLSFEGNTTDNGEGKLSATSTAVTYVPGVNGEAAQFGSGGYILMKAIGDTVTYDNGFKGVSADTLTNLGSFTVAFWMNGVGPVVGGAQGLMAISNKNEFWGNLEMFLENLDAGDTAYLKIHMFNSNVASGNGEEWSEAKIPNALNKWTHIAVTYDAKTSKLNMYADGALTDVADKTLGGGSYGNIKFKDFNGMVLGTYQFQTSPSLTNHGPESWARSLNGAMDQFHIYNRALSASEVQGLVDSKD